MKQYHMGLDGFVWFIGVVEDRNDPSKLGRVKVRCVSFHTDDKIQLPTKDLPWATVMLPTTSTANSGLGSNPFIVEGTWVLGFFLDAEEKQQPMIMGTLPGKPTTHGDPTKGFNDPNARTDDDTKSIYPTETGIAYSDINWRVRGEEMVAYNNRKDISIANSNDTWDEPEPSYNKGVTYPKNHVFQTECGHFTEFDDTKDNERIQEYHAAGTFYEIQPDGTKITKVVGKNYTILAGDDFVKVEGSANLTIDSNCNTHIKGNWNIQVDGDKTEKVSGEVSETFAKNQTTKITGNLDIDTDGQIDLN
jgi:hypothetical protein